jgi:16S rRNA (guanine527-N7)-methyltransferase
MEEASKLALYRELLLEWSAKINLIGPEARENIGAHIDEALLAADLVAVEGLAIDVGSGGGLPAIPMAIRLPQLRFHLVEADRKKWAFLKHVIRECQLNSVAHGGRLADVLPRLELEGPFALVTSRAVGHPEAWLPPLVPLLGKGGRVALFQGEPGAPEIAGLNHEKSERLPRGESNYLVVLQRSTWNHDG